MIVKKIKLPVFKFSLSIIMISIPLFLLCIWFISDPIRSASLDRYILYHVDDIFRYNYIKMALFNPLVLLNPYLKIGYALINTLFLYILPIGISSLRILNSIFSVGTLFLIYKITKKIGLSDIGSAFALLLTLTFPVYFLISISTLAEMVACFLLVLAIYLLYCQKYSLSSLVIAFLPIFRQEGVIFLLAWLLLLPGKLKIKYGLFMILPFLIWSVLNKVLLGHSFLYTFFCNFPDKAPPNCIATFPQFFHLMGILFMHPIFLVCFMGLVFNSRNNKYHQLFICFIFYTVLVLIASVLLFIDTGAFSREIRFLVFLIPIMAIYGALAVEYLLGGKKAMGRYFLLFGLLILPLISVYQIRKLQKDATVITDSVTAKEEFLIKRTTYWLNDYMKKGNIENIYIPGELSIDKFMRRLWMYLPGNIKYYVIIGNMESYKPVGYQPLDMATYTIVPLQKDTKGIFITKNQQDKTRNGINDAQYILLKTEPALSLYFYLIYKGRAE